MRALLRALLLFSGALQIPVYPQADNPRVSRETIEKEQHRRAIEEGLSSADAVAKMFGLRNQLAAGRVSRAAVDKYERETQALVEGRHAKWAATRYLGAYENAYRRAFDDPDYRQRAFEELDRPSFWSSWRLPSFRASWSLPASVTAFVTEWAGLLIVGAGLAICLAFGWYLDKIGWEPEKKDMALPLPQQVWPPLDTYGSAEWEQPHAGLPDQLTPISGVFFGQSSSPTSAHSGAFVKHRGAPIFSTPEKHTLIVAPTGTGKGTRVVIPTLLRYFYGSALVIDPKGENAAVTARARMSPIEGSPVGQAIYIINPWGELAPAFQKLGLSFATYNPLDLLDRNDPNVDSIAQSLAAAICPKPGGGKDPFWADSAASILAAVLLWLTDQPGETKTLARVREIITRVDFRKEFLIPMAASSGLGGAIAENAGLFVNMANETFSGVMGNLGTFTRFLSDRQIKKATATSSFSMRDLPRKPTTIYLVIPPDLMETQRTWLRLMISAGMQTYKHHGMKKPLRCMFLIDEFPALGRLDEVPRDIATMRGYGVDFTLIVQGLDQLKVAYADAAHTILNNCAYKWFCNVNDLESAEYLSKMLGKKTVRTSSGGTNLTTGSSGGSKSTSTSHGETGRLLLMPDELLNLGRDTAILLAPGTKPQYLRPIDYWNLAEAFAHLREVYPEMYWGRFPLKWDENPLPH